MDEQSIGRRLRQARRAAGLSQEGLARRAGVPLLAVRRAEKGQHQSGVVRFSRIVGAIGCSADFVLGLQAPTEAQVAMMEHGPPSALEEWFTGLDVKTQRALLGAALAIERPAVVATLRERLLTGRAARRVRRRAGGR